MLILPETPHRHNQKCFTSSLGILNPVQLTHKLTIAVRGSFLWFYLYFIPFYSWIIAHCMNTPDLFICLSIGGYSGCFNFSVIEMCIHFCINMCFQFFWVYNWSGMAGSCDDLIFNFWGTATVFHSECTILLSPQQCMRILIYPHPHTLCSFFFHYYSQPSGYEVVSHWGPVFSSQLILNL